MDLHEEQRQIEIRMADLGMDRYFRLAQEARQRGEATRSTGTQAVLDAAIGLVSKAITDFMEEARSGGAGRRHSALVRLEGRDPDQCAYIALRIILDGLAVSMPLTSVCTKIGRSVELEARMALLAEREAGYVKKLMTDLDGRTRNVDHRRAVLAKVLRDRGDEWDAWGDRVNLNLGLKLVELVVNATGLFYVRMQSTGGKQTTAVLTPTARFRDWLHSMDTRHALLSPQYLPCVIPPKDWTDHREGGYHTDALAYPPTFVKARGKVFNAALKKADMSRVFEAVNVIQRTPWQVNKRVLAVADVLTEEGRAVAGLPAMDNIPLPARPIDIDTNEEALKGWKREAARTYEANRELTGRRVGVLKTIEVAREFVKYPAIYFPHQVDFRGRVYPIPHGLNPQGNDLTKALLHFAEGDPLDTLDAVSWFLIHGANTFGVDKEPFPVRHQWVEDNRDAIIAVAQDPMTNDWWMGADSPFCFLAWAFEFADWEASGRSGEFVSKIAIAMDGSCNGLQHYSAMLRDPRGGAATNLMPSERPQDIYAEVAKVTIDHLGRLAVPAKDANEEALAKAAMAAAWAGYGITRSITKRPVMVLPYGGTQNSCYEYVREAVADKGGYPFSEEDLHKATIFLGSVVWGAIGEVVTSARLAMGWLKQVASAVSKENLPLIWTTPMGFPVVQNYEQVTSKRIECSLFGARFVPSLAETVEGKIDKTRQANGVAPNFVHSMDASALMATVLLAAKRGVTKFAMIHDSYGTTAKMTAILAAALRDAFVEMYESHDVLANFLNEVLPEHLRAKVEEAPFVGGLDLEDVKRSLYFFA